MTFPALVCANGAKLDKVQWPVVTTVDGIRGAVTKQDISSMEPVFERLDGRWKARGDYWKCLFDRPPGGSPIELGCNQRGPARRAVPFKGRDPRR